MQIARNLPQNILDQLEAKYGTPDRKTSAYYITGNGWGPEIFLGNREEMERMARGNGDQRWQHASRSYAYVWDGEFNKALDSDLTVLGYALDGEGNMREQSRQKALDRGYKLDA